MNMMLSMRTGGKSSSSPIPRDPACGAQGAVQAHLPQLPGGEHAVHGLANHPDFNTVSWKNLRVSVGGGMVQGAVAKLWLGRRAAPSAKAMACRRPSPIVSCNPGDGQGFTGTIGAPLPNTIMKLLDDDGQEVTTLEPVRRNRHQGPGDGGPLAASLTKPPGR